MKDPLLLHLQLRPPILSPRNPFPLPVPHLLNLTDYPLPPLPTYPLTRINPTVHPVHELLQPGFASRVSGLGFEDVDFPFEGKVLLVEGGAEGEDVGGVRGEDGFDFEDFGGEEGFCCCGW